MDTQQCNTCLTEKPLCSFAKNKTKKTGYNNKCKECHKAYLNANRYEPSAQPQVCKKCSQMLPPDKFNLAPHNPTGLSYTCKGCTVYSSKPYSQDQAKKHREARNATMIRRYKKVCGCSTCGHSGHPSGADLDLIHPEKSPIRINWGRKRLKAELRKCDVLCSNCHKIQTFHTSTRANETPTRGSK